MKYQSLFSLKNNGKVFINVVCCSRDWRFKDYMSIFVNLFLVQCQPVVTKSWFWSVNDFY